MIPDSTRTPQTRDWKLEFSRSFRRVDELLAYCGISEYPDPLVRTSNFSFRVTRFYAALIEKGNPTDPLLLQVLPDTQEQHIMPGYHVDAVGDRQATIVPGLIHKYRGRVLLTLTSACAIHCRYCFRRHYPYAENITDISLDGPVMAYLADNPEINEVILSGGDPLMISDEKLSQLITHLNRIPHIRLLRIHSRLLSVLPDRLTESLLASLGRFHGKVILVTHINHANELNDTTRELFLSLQAKGFSLFNQSVLLRRINDDAQSLAELSRTLFECGIIPYYLHRLDKVQGAAHFDINRTRACEIYHELQQLLPGYLLPKMVEEIPGRLSKSTVQCC